MAVAALRYSVRVQDPQAHLFRISLTIARPAALQCVSLPVWIPGSYLVREFSKNLQRLQARQSGQPLAVTQLDKCSWQTQCVANLPLVLSYEICAFDNSVRTAWLDSTRGFFNGTSLFLQVADQQDLPHEVTLVADKAVSGWQLATALTARKIDKNGFGNYVAANYDELVDCPVEMGHFWSGTFVAHGVAHRFVVAGASPSFDGQRLLADSKILCEAEINFWHGSQPAAGAGSKPPHCQPGGSWHCWTLAWTKCTLLVMSMTGVNGSRSRTTFCWRRRTWWLGLPTHWPAMFLLLMVRAWSLGWCHALRSGPAQRHCCAWHPPCLRPVAQLPLIRPCHATFATK